ncbi:MAG: MotA/TolQ/ExbB proton channel family protein [Acetobacteraceae bacterium]|nr:MotA/TolQ/ExbB proton channel family protein [Acetobacteraceae bacterium]
MNGTDFSPIEFFMLAGTVGRAVMVILFAASIWCWVLIIEGIVGVARFRSAIRRWRNNQPTLLFTPIIDAERKATNLRIPGESVGEIRLRTIEAMNRAARGVVRRIEGGMANLAVIASVAPFVGLFGTVWGIMSSFTSIAASNDTSLATVAPGIAEALATTAIGLAAAIPASIGYTRLGAAIGHSAQDLASQIEEEAVRAVTPQSQRVVANQPDTALREVV